MSRVPELGRDGAVIHSLNTIMNKADKVPAVRECRAWDCNGEGGCRGSWLNVRRAWLLSQTALKGLLLEAA